jgi:hypothetical protein
MQLQTNDAGRLLVRGYGPLLVLVIGFGLIALTAPPVEQQLAGEQRPQSAGEQESPASANTDVAAGTAADGGREEGARGGAEAQDAADPQGQDPETATTDQQDDDGAQEGDAAAPATVEGCADRELQVPGDPYSPPCVAFEGGNPGATTRGVTGEEIVISARVLDEPGFQEQLADIAGADIADTPEDVMRTAEGLMDYFNERFEFYGREMVPAFYDGQGSSTEELLGGGHEEARADAITAAQEIEAFAELNAGTEPFAAALADEQVVNIGAPFVSREWFTQRRPYSWSLATDCSIVAESIASWSIERISAQPTAEYARDDFQGEPRRIGLVTPENPFYQECVDAGMAIFEADAPEEVNIVANLSYALDLSTLSNQAANLIARLQNEGVTTVLCNCDPVMPVFLTARATEQDYWPEWNISGVGFTDQDLVGQLFDQQQWARAYGISYVGETLPQQASLGYNAYKQVRDDEPAFAVEVVYYQMYLLAIGIQMAGPDLTPETFEQGMFDYPGGSGPAGTWGFGPENYTPTEDFREVYWDPDKTSPFNNEQGAYVDPNPGQRYRMGDIPPGPPNVPW